MVCRDRSTDVRFCHPFRSLFADFRRFSPLKAHIDPLTTQISKCYTSSSFCPIKILINMIDSKFQRKQNILLRFSIFAIKKKRYKILRKSPLSKFMVIEYAYSICTLAEQLVMDNSGSMYSIFVHIRSCTVYC